MKGCPRVSSKVMGSGLTLMTWGLPSGEVMSAFNVVVVLSELVEVGTLSLDCESLPLPSTSMFFPSSLGLFELWVS